MLNLLNSRFPMFFDFLWPYFNLLILRLSLWDFIFYFHFNYWQSWIDNLFKLNFFFKRCLLNSKISIHPFQIINWREGNICWFYIIYLLGRLMVILHIKWANQCHKTKKCESIFEYFFFGNIECFFGLSNRSVITMWVCFKFSIL